MGLLSFFKRENDRLRTPLKGRPYHTTVQAQPPVQGTYPITGNKPPVRKHVPRRIDTNEPSSPVDRTAARGRFESRTEHTFAPSDLRPSTAPSGVRPGSNYQRPASWFKRDFSRPPTATLRKPSLADFRPRSSTGPAAPAPTTDDDVIFFEPNLAVTPLRPLTSYSHSSRAAPAHVDLLDAQSQFKHADFRSRIAAAGARDYGEDVADRNIAPNSGGPGHCARPSMSSRRTSSYHSLAPGDAAPHLRRLASSAEVTRSLTLLHSRHASWAEKDTAGAGGYARPRPATSGAFMPFPSRAEGFGPRDARTTSRSRSRGTSVSTHEEYPWDSQSRERRPRHRGMSYAASSNDLTASAHASTASLGRGRDSSGGRTLRARSRSYHRSDDAGDLAFLGSEPPLPPPPPPPPPTSMTPAATRRQWSRDGMRAEAGSSPEEFSAWADEASSAPPPIRGARRRSKTTMGDYRRWPSFRGDGGDRDGAPEWAGGYGLGHIDVESGGEDASEAWSPAPAPHVRRGGDRADPLYGHDRARSLGPFRAGDGGGGARSRLDGICEAVTLRRGSIRHSSISSTTLTTSSGGSSAFQRPHSRHTAQTSIDDSPAFPSFGVSPAPGEKGYAAGPDDSFNLDDYISSSEEDESADEARHPLSPDGENLLFSDSGGYGFRGAQLPGLFDTIPELPSAEDPAGPAQTPRHGSGGSGHSVGSTRSTGSMYSARSTYSAESGPPPSPTRARPTSRAGVAPVDMKMAVRMRKESKARLRMRWRDLVGLE